MLPLPVVKSCFFYSEIQQGSLWTQFSGNYQNSVFVMGMRLDLSDRAGIKCLELENIETSSSKVGLQGHKSECQPSLVRE